MREIKFRAWDSIRKTMVYQPQIMKITGDGQNWRYAASVESHEAWPTIMQYTGLKDKNGKEIYEGDIVRTPWLSIDGLNVYDDWIMVYSEENAGFQLQSKENSEYLESPTVYRIPDDYEVIGNIWEHPELLENQNDTQKR